VKAQEKRDERALRQKEEDHVTLGGNGHEVTVKRSDFEAQLLEKVAEAEAKRELKKKKRSREPAGGVQTWTAQGKRQRKACRVDPGRRQH